jgi:hypothetical protein
MATRGTGRRSSEDSEAPGREKTFKDRERWESVFKERQMSVGLHLRSLSRESIKVKLDYRRCEFGLQ